MQDIFNRQKILLVDTDGPRRERMTEALQSSYQVIPAYDGEMALEVLSQTRDFAAILIQCELYELSGFDVMVRLHANRALSAIPVLAVGHGPKEEFKALSLGALVFVERGRDPHMVRYQIQNILELLHNDNDMDSLTGVLQWKPFLIAVRKLLDAGRESARNRYVMAVVNIERFKVFNDLFGRGMGDMLLRALAARLKPIAAGSGAVGRLGGDRFALCCRGGELNAGLFEHLGEDLMQQLQLKYGLRVSCGVYEIDDTALPVDEMCDRARIALNLVSARGEDPVAFYDEKIREDLLWEQSVVAQMQEALESGQFQVYLQPIISLTAGVPVSAEALVRWNHPQMGLIPPGRFIPIFERNGFISRLDYYVWERAFQYLAEIKKRGYPDFSVSANMSRLDIYDTDVCARVAALAEKYGVDRSTFRIEVTETAYMNDPERLLETTRQFNAAGFAVLMDDFGSGYSSLNMLMRMPVSTLKLDMAFTRNVGVDERTNCVVGSVLRMAKWLEMSVVAEGAETVNQVEYLRSIGCDKVQGYYFSKPLPWENFLELLSKYDGAAAKEPARVFDEAANTQRVWDTITAYDRMLHGQMDAAALYEQAEDLLEILCVNDAYYRLMESSPGAMSKDSQSATGWIWSGDRARFMDALEQSRITDKRQELVISRYVDSSRLKNLMVSVCYLGRKDNRKLYLLLFRDISALDMTLSKPLEESPAPAAPFVGCRSCRRVLIVEDNPVNRTVLRKMLSGDYEILEAVNGLEGLELLRRDPKVTAVLLDIIMPIMDGYEFLRSKREDPAIRDVPVLVLSQSDSRGSEVKALDLGAAGFVRKPYDPEALRRLVESLVEPGAEW